MDNDRGSGAGRGGPPPDAGGGRNGDGVCGLEDGRPNVLAGIGEDEECEVAIDVDGDGGEWLLIDSGSPVTGCALDYAPEVPVKRSQKTLNLRGATGDRVHQHGEIGRAHV